MLKEDINKIESRASLKNLKRGFNEEKIFGPICTFLLFLYIFLFILKIISLLILFYSFVLIAFIFLVYFPYHKKPVILFFLILTIAPLTITGIWAILTKKVFLSDIKYLIFLWEIFLVGGIIIRHFALKKHKIEDVDITLARFKKKFGTWIVPILNIASFLLFPMFAGSLYIFGKQQIYLWAPIFLFWAISGIRLIKYKF